MSQAMANRVAAVERAIGTMSAGVLETRVAHCENLILTLNERLQRLEQIERKRRVGKDKVGDG